MGVYLADAIQKTQECVGYLLPGLQVYPFREYDGYIERATAGMSAWRKKLYISLEHLKSKVNVLGTETEFFRLLKSIRKNTGLYVAIHNLVIISGQWNLNLARLLVSLDLLKKKKQLRNGRFRVLSVGKLSGLTWQKIKECEGVKLLRHRLVKRVLKCISKQYTVKWVIVVKNDEDNFEDNDDIFLEAWKIDEKVKSKSSKEQSLINSNVEHGNTFTLFSDGKLYMFLLLSLLFLH